MAIRNIRTFEDEILRKKCKEVKIFDQGLASLVEDMFDTMYSANGVGLAAPQIDIIKRIVVIDDYEGHKFELINPVITYSEGEQVYTEGCLSLPGYCGEVTRPEKVRVSALNREGKPVEIEGEGLLAVIICHELDHLEGILYKDKASDYRVNKEKKK